LNQPWATTPLIQPKAEGDQTQHGIACRFIFTFFIIIGQVQLCQLRRIGFAFTLAADNNDDDNDGDDDDDEDDDEDGGEQRPWLIIIQT